VAAARVGWVEGGRENRHAVMTANVCLLEEESAQLDGL
jgi:hypothetical protein